MKPVENTGVSGKSSPETAELIWKMRVQKVREIV